MDIKYIKNFFNLNEKQMEALFYLIRNGRMRDSELRSALGFSSVTSAAHYRKNLEKRKVILGYTAVVDWKKLGYKTKFMIIVEGKDEEALREISRNHILLTKEYLKTKGEIAALQMPHGKIILRDVLTCQSGEGVIIGYATSDIAAKEYSEFYLKELHPDIETRLFIMESATIENFFIQKKFIEKCMRMIKIKNEDKIKLEDFRDRLQC